MDARIEPLSGALPSINWRWDSETDILSGAFKGNRKSGGLTGSVELTDAEGSVAVLDVNNGVICGLDVVVWPEVVPVRELQVPAKLTDGRVVLPARPSRPGVASLEVDTSLSVQTNPLESVFISRSGLDARSRVSVPPTTSISRWTSRAGWPDSGSPTCHRSLPWTTTDHSGLSCAACLSKKASRLACDEGCVVPTVG